jgi:hypothetical protein
MNDRRLQNTSITKRDYSISSYKCRIRKLLLIFYVCYYKEVIKSEICNNINFFDKTTTITLLSKKCIKIKKGNVLHVYILT